MGVASLERAGPAGGWNPGRGPEEGGACAAGADAIKTQCFTPEDMALPGHKCTSGPWAGRDLFDLYRECAMPLDWHEPLKRCANDLGLAYFASSFQPWHVDFLEGLGVPAHLGEERLGKLVVPGRARIVREVEAPAWRTTQVHLHSPTSPESGAKSLPSVLQVRRPVRVAAVSQNGRHALRTVGCKAHARKGRLEIAFWSTP